MENWMGCFGQSTNDTQGNGTLLRGLSRPNCLDCYLCPATPNETKIGDSHDWPGRELFPKMEPLGAHFFGFCKCRYENDRSPKVSAKHGTPKGEWLDKCGANIHAN